MSGYTVSLTAMNEAIDQAQSASAQISSTLQALEQEVGQSLASWTGDAAQEYQAAKQNWDQVAAQMPVTLNSAHNTLSTISTNYAAAERAAMATFQG